MADISRVEDRGRALDITEGSATEGLGEFGASLGPDTGKERTQGGARRALCYDSYPFSSRYYYADYGPYYGRNPRDDGDIERDVRQTMAWDTHIDAGRIHVNVHDGTVTLKGTVSSPVEKRSAGDDAWDTPGVRDVRNELAIKW